MGEEEKKYSGGNIRISEDVIVSIISLEVAEIEGAAISPASPMDITELLSKKGPKRGIRVNMDGDTVSADIGIQVDYGQNIPQLALHVQQKVKTAIESMTNLEVKALNISVVNVEEKKAEDKKPEEKKEKKPEEKKEKKPEEKKDKKEKKPEEKKDKKDKKPEDKKEKKGE